MEIKLIKFPTEKDWLEVKERALLTVGKRPIHPPSSEWKHDILEARHSPIRILTYSFLIIGIPYCTSTHFARHVHAQPYIRSQRNDRQDAYDRNKAPQDAPVNMIYDVNAEELMAIANKRLCYMADENTRRVTRMMCELAIEATPELKGLLVPMCIYCGGVCHEMHPCKEMERYRKPKLSFEYPHE